MTGVSEPIMTRLDRIGRLFAALDDIARFAAARNGGGAALATTLGQVWERIAGLLEQYADAEKEVWCYAMSEHRTDGPREIEKAIADLDRIRAAVAEARLHDPGCRPGGGQCALPAGPARASPVTPHPR